MAQKRRYAAAAFLLCFAVQQCCCKEWESFQLTVPHPQGERVQLTLSAHVLGEAREGQAHVSQYRGEKELKLQHLVTSNKNRTDVSSVSNDQIIKVDSPVTNVLASLQTKRGVSSALTLLDAYRPVSDRCLGTKYTVAAVEARAGHSFIVLKSLHEETLVTLTLNGDSVGFFGALLEVDGRLYSPGDTVVLKLQPHTSRTLTSVDVGSGLGMTGVSIVTSEPVAVFAGSVASELDGTGANAKRLASSVAYEMLPPQSMLGTEYVVSSPEMATLTGGRLTIVKIIGSYQKDMTSVHVTSYSGSGSYQSKVSSDLETLHSGQVVIRLLKSSASLVVASDQPLQVLQLILRDDGRHESMAVLPARHEWTNMYQVHALPVRNQIEAVHRATIVAETAQIQDLLVISQTDFTDLSQDLDWVTIGDSGLSTATVVLKPLSMVKIFHIDQRASFQVMLSGINSKGTGSYSTTAGRNHRCDETLPYKALKNPSSELLLFRPRRSVTASPVVTSTTTPADSTTNGVTATTTPSQSTTTSASNTTVAANVTASAANVTSNVTTQAPTANTTTTAAPENADSGMSTGAIAGTAAAVGAAVTGAVVAAVAVNATGAAVAASGTAAAATVVGANAAAASAAVGNAAAAAGANVATGATVATTHGGGAIASAANPALVAVV